MKRGAIMSRGRRGVDRAHGESFSSGSVVARRFGVVRPARVTSTIAFGSSVQAPQIPRGR